MDIYCPVCGEPCEIDTLHDAAQETGKTFAEIRDTFQTEGCATAIPGFTCTPNKHPERAAMAAMLADLLGDDIDGIAAAFEDFEELGL